LVVVCSPNSAGSKWVNEEIRTFAQLGRRQRVQCLIVSGVSHAAAKGQDPALECLPPALFGGGAAEPLAADLRPGGDDRATAKLKLIAGILGVGFDELRQREQARRQRQLLAVAGVSAVGFVAMSALAGVAIVSRNEAVRQRDIARQKTLTAERTASFVKSLFQVSDPSESRGDTLTAREILDRGARELDQGLAREPTVKADLSTTLGEVYGSLGLVRQSTATLLRGMQLVGVAPGTRARQYVALAHAKWQAGDYEASIAADQHALALLPVEDDASDALRARILSGFSVSHMRTGDHAAAEREARAALALDRKLHPEETQIAFDLEVLGQALLYGGKLDDAAGAIGQALEVRLRKQGASHPLVADDYNSLGSIAYLKHDPAAAEQDFRRALSGYEAVLGPNHPMVASALNNLGRILLERRAFEEARRLLTRALRINLKEVSEEADDLIFEYANLGIAERGVGDLAGAEAAFEKAEHLARQRKHRNLAPVLVERAELACMTGGAARGLELIAEAQPIMAAAYKKDAWRTAWVEAVHADCLARSGNRSEAAALLKASAPIIQSRWAPASLYGERLSAMLARANAAPGSHAGD
jgi:tetratricopeptide (TPR) repeat protein